MAGVYAIAFGLSLGAVLFNPAANSALPALVCEDELVAANSGIWTAAVLSQIALAPVAGILYAAVGAGPAFGINAASFVISAALLTGLRLPAAVASLLIGGLLAAALGITAVYYLGGALLLLAAGIGRTATRSIPKQGGS